WIVVVAFCVGDRPLGAWPLKALCLAASAAAFLAAAWPILRAYSQGSNSGHVALLGLMTTFDQPLGIRQSIYERGRAHLDGDGSALVNSFTLREHGHPVAYLSKEYDAGMAAYLLQIARHWPADMLVRAYASVLRVVDVPFHVGTYTAVVPYGLAN